MTMLDMLPEFKTIDGIKKSSNGYHGQEDQKEGGPVDGMIKLKE